MNIGFDLDKVFINYPPCLPSQLFDKLYKKKDNGILVYRIPQYPEQLIRKATHLPFLRPPITKNLEFLKSIPKAHNKLYLISSRYHFLEKATERVTKKHGLDKIFDKMYFNFKNKQPHIFKDEIIRPLKLDIYIDDDLSLLKYVAKNNPNVKFFWLTKQRDKQVLPSNITAIEKLSQIDTLSSIIQKRS
jgi:hypothetical protein